MLPRLLLMLLLLTWLGMSGQPATFQVLSVGLTPEQQTAVDYATQQWSKVLQSQIPIKVNLRLVPAPGLLGITIPNGQINFPGTPITNVWYPSCLANDLAGTELNPGEADMDVVISTLPNWYYGIDGQPGPGQLDFVTVLMHEIGHGLGFASLAKVEAGLGSFGFLTAGDFAPLAISFPFPDLMGAPSTFDLFLENNMQARLADPVFFINNSTALAAEMTSDQIFLDGNFRFSLADTSRPRVYAPTTFQLGSSMTHLSEQVYPPGDTNALMTPFSQPQEVNHDPGPIVLGVFEEMGWRLNNDSIPTSVVPEDLAQRIDLRWGPNPVQDRLHIFFELDQVADTRLAIFDALGRKLAQLSKRNCPAGQNQMTLEIKSVAKTSGMLFFKLEIGPERLHKQIRYLSP